jgi:MFS family permease
VDAAHGLDSDPGQLQRRTYALERARAVVNGIVESAGSIFLMLIAVRHFHAGETAKGILATGGAAGNLLGPFVVAWVAKAGLPVAQGASLLLRIGGLGFLAAAFFPAWTVFAGGSLLALVTLMAVVPLVTQIYQDNYPDHKRGRLFARTVMVRIVSTAVFSYLAGRLLDADMGWFRGLLLLYALLFWTNAWLLSRYPSRPLPREEGGHPLRSLRYLGTDRLFRWTLVSWMFMGFGNLMMIPLRVEYLANPAYGFHLSEAAVAILVGVIPNVTRLVLNPLWGFLFDRLNFFVMRFVLNLMFLTGILSFFLSDSLAGLVAGALFFGMAISGGDLAWSLWVTKIAPPHLVADYMSVHTFFTGIRGVLAPFAAFYLLGYLEMGQVVWISGGLILVASLLLTPEMRSLRRRRPGEVLPGPVSE